MENIRILLCCGAGMSSGLLAQQIKIAARKRSVDATVQSSARSGLMDLVHKFDIILLAPHYTGELEKIQKLCATYHIPVQVIPSEYFGTLNGEDTLTLVLQTLSKE